MKVLAISAQVILPIQVTIVYFKQTNQVQTDNYIANQKQKASDSFQGGFLNGINCKVKFPVAS